MISFLVEIFMGLLYLAVFSPPFSLALSLFPSHTISLPRSISLLTPSPSFSFSLSFSLFLFPSHSLSFLLPHSLLLSFSLSFPLLSFPLRLFAHARFRFSTVQKFEFVSIVSPCSDLIFCLSWRNPLLISAFSPLSHPHSPHTPYDPTPVVHFRKCCDFAMIGLPALYSFQSFHLFTK